MIHKMPTARWVPQEATVIIASLNSINPRGRLPAGKDRRLVSPLGLAVGTIAAQSVLSPRQLSRVVGGTHGIARHPQWNAERPQGAARSQRQRRHVSDHDGDPGIPKGPNKEISPSDLAKSIGMDDVDTIAKQTGLSRDNLLSRLSQQLPQVIDQLTPNGRLPNRTRGIALALKSSYAV
jgi:AraC-like DNA-binding protein